MNKQNTHYKNKLLDGLPSHEYEKLEPHLEQVKLTSGVILYNPYDVIHYACWLLHAHDCVGNNELALTQQFIAQMLGVRRATVTQVVQKFQENEIIHYSRGHIRILNRLFLELSACECYKFVKSEFKRLLNFS